MSKVLYVADGLTNGGAERQLALLIKCRSSEWETRVWSLGDGPFADVIRQTGALVEVRKRRWRYDVTPFFDLWRLLCQWRPSVVHSWGWVCSAAVAPLCRLLHIPWVDGTIRIGWMVREHVLRARVALTLADRVVANSQTGLDAWGIPGAKGRVIYNAFDPERWPLTRHHSHIRHEPFTVVMTGRMSPVKDFHSFVSVARLLAAGDRENSWRFLAIGSGPQRVDLMESASDLVNEGVMVFPDAGLEVLPHIRGADVGVLMTNPVLLAEGCSNSIMEYMACGLPVVCSESGGNRELVVDGRTGFVIPPLDADALSERLRYLRSRPDVVTQMGKAGRKRVSQEFTAQAMVQKTVTVYEELLECGGAQSQ